MVDIAQNQISIQTNFAKYESQIEEMKNTIPKVITHRNPELSDEEVQEKLGKALDYLVKLSIEYGKNQRIYDEWADSIGRQEYIAPL